VKPRSYRTHTLCLTGLLLLWALWSVGHPALQAMFTPDPVWQRIQTSGVWRVGLDPSFPPLTTLNAQGEPAGIEVCLVRHLAEQMGVRLQVVSLSFDALYPALEAGQVDSIIGGLPFDPLLTRDVRYSRAYLDGGLLLVWRETTPEPSRNLAGKRVAVVWGGDGDRFLRETERRGTTLSALRFLTPAEALRSLRQGNADVAIVNAITVYTAAITQGDIRWAWPPLLPQPYHIAMPANAHRLQKALNNALHRLPAQKKNDLPWLWSHCNP